MFYSRGTSSSGGAQQFRQSPGRTLRGNYGQIQLGKNVARKMIALRLSGWTQEQCDEWLEQVCQELEAIEKEMLSGEEH